MMDFSLIHNLLRPEGFMVFKRFSTANSTGEFVSDGMTDLSAQFSEGHSLHAFFDIDGMDTFGVLTFNPKNLQDGSKVAKRKSKRAKGKRKIKTKYKRHEPISRRR